MNYIVINTNEYNGYQNANGVFYAIPILSGSFNGNFACFENQLIMFPEIFEKLSYSVENLEETFYIDFYTSQPEIDQYRLIDVTDLYNETININLFDNLTLQTSLINRPYINGTWTDADVVFYVNQLNEEAKLK
jgi:hypothetical protein